jgi:DNA-binding phage protein
MTSDTSTQSEIAADLVDKIFADRERIMIADARQLATEAGISRRSIERAMASAGVRTIRNGRHPGSWARPGDGS